MKKLRVSFLITSLLFIILSSSVFAQEESTTVYRLYNEDTQEHLYTTQRLEVEALTEIGWDEEGIGWRCPNIGEAVYRLYNPASNDHLYTLDSNEVSVLTSQQGWQADFNGQPLFYSGGGIPVFRLYNPNNGRHHLTTDSYEYDLLSNSGWSGEGQKMSCQSGFIQYLDTEAVIDRLMSLQSEYPEGRTWTNEDFYGSKLGYEAGYGCQAFALICSDAVFNRLPFRTHHDISNIKIGDILRTDNNTHSVVVTGINGNELTLVEGNYNDSIHWGRKVDVNDLDIEWIKTRYPE